MLTEADIRRVVDHAGLSGRVVCAHASVRSFGPIEGGAGAIVSALLAQGCTLVVPTFTYEKACKPPAGWSLARNGWSAWDGMSECRPEAGFSASGNDLTLKHMGALPAAVLARPDRVRGDHPLNSFSAVGPRVANVIAGQRPLDVYYPFRRLVEHDGAVVMMGVSLTTMTFLHYAEQIAGRTLFRRWARLRDGPCIECEVGSCSDGFEQFAPHLAPVERQVTVGASRWRIFPARDTVAIASQQIRISPSITHCPRLACERCIDAIAGGPVL
jgi:aminoglycoside N3'-acetyltransferase